MTESSTRTFVALAEPTYRVMTDLAAARRAPLGGPDLSGRSVYDYWRAALRGDVLPADQHLPTGLGGVEGHPQPGLYKRRDNGAGRSDPPASRYVPVKIYLADASGQIAHTWSDGLTIGCVVGSGEVADPLKVWTWCLTRAADGRAIGNAVSQADYKHWIAHGRWPDDTPALDAGTEPRPGMVDAGTAVAVVGPTPTAATAASPAGMMGHNSINDADGAEALRVLLQQHKEAIEAWCASGAEGKAAADKATNWTRDVIALEKRVNAAYAVQKEPILKAEREIDAVWRPIKTLAEQVKRHIDGYRLAVARKEQARLQAIADAEAAARAEIIKQEHAAEHRRLAAEAAQRAESPPPSPVIPEVVAEKVRPTFGGSTGHRMGVRPSPSVAIITDWRAAAAHYALAPKIQEIVQKLANADAKNGVACPGGSIGARDAA